MDSFAAIRPMLTRVLNQQVSVGERFCKACDTVKPLTEFYANGRTTRTGEPARSYRCKRCDIQRIKVSRG